MLDRVRHAVSSETVNTYFHERLGRDLKKRGFAAKLRRSYEDAVEKGKVRHWRQLYPEA